MARSPRFTVQIAGDEKDFLRAMKKVEGRLGGVGGKFAKFGKMAALGLGAVAGGALLAAPKILEMAANLEQLQRKAKVVFEDQLPAVQRWARANAASMGLTSTELVGLSAGFADLLKPMGFSTEQASTMSMEVNGLAGALAEWSGGQRTAAEVSAILGKAMLGERESLKELGISITQAEVDTRALEVAMADGRTEVTAMDRAVASQKLIMEKSVDAQTAYADGADTIGRKWSEAKAVLKEVSERVIAGFSDNIAAFLLKAAPKLVEFVEGPLATFIADVEKAFDEDGMGGVLKVFGDAIETTLPTIMAFLTETVLPPMIDFGLMVGREIGWAIIKGLGEGISNLPRTIVENLPTILGVDPSEWLEDTFPEPLQGVLLPEPPPSNTQRSVNGSVNITVRGSVLTQTDLLQLMDSGGRSQVRRGNVPISGGAF